MWRIDTIDPRGGLSFTSWREATLFNGDQLEDAPVFYICAPSFTPVAVANRSVALAAERQGFQLGLLDKRGEVGFETLDEVAEFVRRLYLSNSRGDTTDGGAAPTVPRPEGGPSLEGEEPVIDSPLSGAAAKFVQMKTGVERGHSLPAEWQITLGGGAGLRTLTQGAEILMIELLSRFPTDDAGLERWRASSIRLASVIGRLGLSRMMRSRSLVSACQYFLRNDWSRYEPRSVPDDEEAVVRTLQVMTHQTTEIYWQLLPGMMNGRGMEPMDELGALPLPERLVTALHLPPENAGSAATVVSAALGSPALLARTPELDAILLLAACRIVAFDGSPHVATAFPAWWGPHGWDDATSEVRLTAMLEAARDWLEHNLPSRVFHQDVEDIIDSIAPTLHNTPQGGGTPLKADGSRDRFADAFDETEAEQRLDADEHQAISPSLGG